MMHLVFTRFSFNDKLTFSTFTEQIFPGLSLMFCFGLGLTMLVFYSLMYLYLWPYKIETDPDNPLHWYYPFTCSFWCR